MQTTMTVTPRYRAAVAAVRMLALYALSPVTDRGPQAMADAMAELAAARAEVAA